MNILRWNRKSKKKFNPKTLILLIFSLIMTTFAWFAYSKVLEPSLNIHMASWDMEYKINGQPKTNPISINMPLYPTMSEETVVVDIFNNGETLVDIDHQVKSLTIAGIRYEAVREGETPQTDRYITIAPTIETENETYKGIITNDITKFPFIIEVEYSTQVQPVTVSDYGVNTPGQGYLKVTVNWLGDNNNLDSEWGYLVGEYLANNPEASAMTIELSIDSYQADPKGASVLETTMPSTSTTKPYLPNGFTRVIGTTLQSGLVIEDSNENQYVWVEVPKSTSVYQTAGLEITDFTQNNAYGKIETDLRNYVSGYSTRADVYTDENAIGLSPEGYTALKQKVLKSIYKYGGFYIGRYETGISSGYRTGPTTSVTARTAVIKSDVYPYNYVTCSQANTLASYMVSADSGYTSSLMFGFQWDLVMKYLETKAVEQVPASEKATTLTNIQKQLKTDSSSWGNYKNNSFMLLNSNVKYMTNLIATQWLSALPFEKNDDQQVLITSGGNSGMCKQNIYDLAGNLSEWTYNVVSTANGYVGGNGGNYFIESGVGATDNETATTYGNYNVMNAKKEVGFRVSLISNT